MNRRSLLALLGIAPAVVVAPKLLSASTLGTHPVMVPPNIQCGRCGDGLAFAPLERDYFLEVLRNRGPFLAKCYTCGVIMTVPVPFIDCKVQARDDR